MNKHTILFFLFCIQLSILGAQTTNFYVSPEGKDTHLGTLKKPFKTIERARQAVDQINDDMKGPINVYLKGGTYLIDQTLLFTEADGGSNGHTISYKAYEKEQPIISSGVQITDWTSHEKGIWKAPAKGLNFRQLYVGDHQATRARTPNKGDYYRIAIWDVSTKEVYVEDGATEKWNSTPDIIKDWNQFERIEMILQISWTEQIMRLKSATNTSVDKGSGGWTQIFSKIKFQEPEGSMLFKRDYPSKRSGTPFHLENAYEFIDEPGEWYLDVEADMLYYMPKPGQDMQKVQVMVGTVETLLAVKGKIDRKVENLTFEGIKFAYTNWMLPSKQGLAPCQASQYNIEPTIGNEQYVMRPSAAIYAENAVNLHFHKNELTRISNSVTVDYHHGVSNSSIKGNLIHQVAGTGIMAAKFSDPDMEIHLPYNPQDQREVCENIVISNNLITNIGLNYPGCIGIGVGWGKAITIEHNEISYTPYSGISLGWGWTKAPNVMENNIIRYNDIHHISQLLSDAGGIYTLSFQPGTQIYRNYVHDSQKSKWGSAAPFTGIYQDQGSGGTINNPMVIKDNIVTSGGHTSLFMNMVGIVRYENNMASSPPREEDTYTLNVYKDIMENVGLQKAYKDLKARITPNN